MATLGKDNQALLAVIGPESLAKILYDRINLMVVCGHLDIKQDPVALIEHCLVDAVRVFVKNEPHKRIKIETGRLRLICSCSTVDQLVERVLYQNRTKKEIANWEDLPSKPGMGSTDENLHSIGCQIAKLLSYGADVDSDVSGWDWRRKKWLAFTRVIADALAFDVPPDSDYFKLLWNREVCACNTVFALSNGLLLTLNVEGIMLSGRFITSYGNSKERVGVSSLCGTLAMAMGDDCNESLNGLSFEEFKTRMASLGYEETAVEYAVTTEVEGTAFCSSLYYRKGTRWSAEPVRWLRTLYRLLCKGKDRVPYVEIAQFCYEIRNLRQPTEELKETVYREYLLRDGAVSADGA